MARTTINQSVFDFAMREINALEGRILKAEDNADAMLWEQANQVVAQLDAGLSQVKLAAQWINGRTTESYSRRHVQIVEQLGRCYLNSTLQRPRFRDAYNEIANDGGPGASKFEHLTGDVEWYTPASVLDAARAVMGGGIDLDPASSEYAQQTVKATRYYTEQDNGLEQEWHGRVFLNPPFHHPTIRYFADKLLASPEVSQAVWLSNACVEVDWWQALAAKGIVCFHRGRIKFHSPTGRPAGSPPDGQTIIYLGPHHDQFRAMFAPLGVVLT